MERKPHESSEESADSTPTGAEWVAHQLRVRVYSSHLTPSQRRISEYLLSNPHRAPFISITDLANAAGTGVSSITRFVRALGWESYPAMRNEVAQWYQSPAGFDPLPAPPSQSQRFIESVINDLQTASQTDGFTDGLKLAAEIIAGSPSVPVIALRLARPAGDHFAFSAQKIHPGVRLISRSDGTGREQLVECAEAGAQVVVVFGYSRPPRELRAMLELATSLDLSIVFLGDDQYRSIAHEARVLILTRTDESLVFDTNLGIFASGSLLLNELYLASPENRKENLERFERRAAQAKLFLTERSAQRVTDAEEGQPPA